MNRNNNRNQELDFPDIEAFLRLALAAPDDELIGHFLGSEGSPTASASHQAAMSDAERRWVSTNIRHNPQWKYRAVALASAAGRVVSEPSQSFRTGLRQTNPTAAATRPRKGVFISARAAAATVALLFVAYATMVVGSNRSMSVAERLGSVRPMTSELEVGARDVRALTYNMDHGVTHLLAAERRFAGIFLGFEEIHTLGAIASLQRAFNENMDPFHRAEVAYFIGKAYLMQGDTFRAHDWLQTSLDQRVVDYREEVLELAHAVARLEL